jgi:hypothetical protein
MSRFCLVPKKTDRRKRDGFEVFGPGCLSMRPNSLRKWVDIRRERKAAMLERIGIQSTTLLSHRTLIHLRESHHQFSRHGKIRLAICLQADDGRS